MSASSKDRLGKEAIYPAKVILEPCPKCNASPGEKCSERYGGKVITRATPHMPRIEASNPKI